ncbi:hypothetical protein M885DRAFT_547109 [Pelagophyceae sp. CCMP2097]|nr:hypothetical protein M885DRAFT_547109 [Pelagophyceae sp. CCMP2097]
MAQCRALQGQVFELVAFGRGDEGPQRGDLTRQRPNRAPRPSPGARAAVGGASPHAPRRASAALVLVRPGLGARVGAPLEAVAPLDASNLARAARKELRRRAKHVSQSRRSPRLDALAVSPRAPLLWDLFPEQPRSAIVDALALPEPASSTGPSSATLTAKSRAARAEDEYDARVERRVDSGFPLGMTKGVIHSLDDLPLVRIEFAAHAAVIVRERFLDALRECCEEADLLWGLVGDGTDELAFLRCEKRMLQLKDALTAMRQATLHCVEGILRWRVLVMKHQRRTRPSHFCTTTFIPGASALDAAAHLEYCGEALDNGLESLGGRGLESLEGRGLDDFGSVDGQVPSPKFPAGLPPQQPPSTASPEFSARGCGNYLVQMWSDQLFLDSSASASRHLGVAVRGNPLLLDTLLDPPLDAAPGAVDARRRLAAAARVVAAEVKLRCERSDASSADGVSASKARGDTFLTGGAHEGPLAEGSFPTGLLTGGLLTGGLSTGFSSTGFQSTGFQSTSGSPGGFGAYGAPRPDAGLRLRSNQSMTVLDLRSNTLRSNSLARRPPPFVGSKSSPLSASQPVVPAENARAEAEAAAAEKAEAERSEAAVVLQAVARGGAQRRSAATALQAAQRGAAARSARRNTEMVSLQSQSGRARPPRGGVLSSDDGAPDAETPDPATPDVSARPSDAARPPAAAELIGDEASRAVVAAYARWTAVTHASCSIQRAWRRVARRAAPQPRATRLAATQLEALARGRTGRLAAAARRRAMRDAALDAADIDALALARALRAALAPAES